MTVINHTIITGQSNAVFATGASLLGPQTRPTQITYFSGGARVSLDNANNWPERALADTATPTSPAGYQFNIRTGALSGALYTAIKKGTSTYTRNINNLQAGKNTAVANGDSVIARALYLIHGEADQSGGTSRATYLTHLAEWLNDYNVDCKAITGQTEDMVGITWQASFVSDSRIAPAQLDAQRTLSRFYCSGPVYHLPNTPPHVTDTGSVYLGEHLAKVHRAVVINGGPWSPTAPARVVSSGRFITVYYNVPVAPLVFDTTIMSARTNMGFSYTDDTSSATIASVAIVGGTAVRITLSNTPTGANPRVKYGATGLTGGNLRDSDPYTSILDATPLHNWGCLFDDPVVPVEAAPRFFKITVGGGPVSVKLPPT